MKKRKTDDRYADDYYPDEDDWDEDPDDEDDWEEDPDEYEPEDRRRPPRRARRRKRGGWLRRKLIGLIALAVVVALTIAFFPYIRAWVIRLLPRLDYAHASEILSQTMEEKGDYVADEVTIEGVLYGTQSVDIIIKIPYLSVEADYIYKAQIGVKLSEVRLTPLEDRLVVTVPDMAVLYDSITINGEPRYDDFWSLQSQANFQKLVANQREDCNRIVSEDQEKMAQAWQHTCAQLSDWFEQWIGEELTLTFAHPGEEPAGAETPAALPAAGAAP